MGKRPADWSSRLAEALTRVGTRGSRDYMKRNQRYIAWRLRHPLRSFTDWYVAEESKRLDAGIVHPSLGQRTADEGGHALKFVQDQGLQPHHRVVDYGCGSLRLGQRFIGYLDPGNYWGLDVTDRFFRDGLAALPPEVVAAKRPQLAVIDRAVIRRLAADPPDFVLVSGVLHHVPPRRLGGFFDNLARLSGPRTRTYIWFLAAETLQQTGPYAFRHPPDLLIELGRRRGLTATLLEIYDYAAGPKPVTRGLIELVRPGLQPAPAMAAVAAPAGPAGG